MALAHRITPLVDFATIRGQVNMKKQAETPRRSRRRIASAKQTLLTARQAEELTGLPYTTIRDLHLRGHLPIVKLPQSRRWWIERRVLEALIARSVVQESV